MKKRKRWLKVRGMRRPAETERGAGDGGEEDELRAVATCLVWCGALSFLIIVNRR